MVSYMPKDQQGVYLRIISGFGSMYHLCPPLMIPQLKLFGMFKMFVLLCGFMFHIHGFAQVQYHTTVLNWPTAGVGRTKSS